MFCLRCDKTYTQVCFFTKEAARLSDINSPEREETQMLIACEVILHLNFSRQGVNSSNNYTVNTTTMKGDEGGEGICPSLPISL